MRGGGNYHERVCWATKWFRRPRRVTSDLYSTPASACSSSFAPFHHLHASLQYIHVSIVPSTLKTPIMKIFTPRVAPRESRKSLNAAKGLPLGFVVGEEELSGGGVDLFGLAFGVGDSVLFNTRELLVIAWARLVEKACVSVLSG